jgi:hypothetical protein
MTSTQWAQIKAQTELFYAKGVDFNYAFQMAFKEVMG